MYSIPNDTGGRRGRRRHRRAAMSGRRHGAGRYGPRDWGHGRRRRMRRGEVRAAILVLLDEESRTGYALMEEIERRSDGTWRPSPGSIYPALALLEDEGLVLAEAEQGRKPFVLTEAGRTYVAEHREELGEPWAKLDEGDGWRELRALVGEIGAAVFQVAAAGDEAQVKRAKELLTDTRRGLYRILADDEPGETTGA